MTLRRAEQSVVQRRPREREKKKKTREIRGKFNEAKKRIQGKEENNLKKKVNKPPTPTKESQVKARKNRDREREKLSILRKTLSEGVERIQERKEESKEGERERQERKGKANQKGARSGVSACVRA